MNKQIPDIDFQHLTSQIKHQIDSKGVLEDQGKQVELLFALEKRFQNNIRKYSKTIEIYQLFIDFIKNEGKNLLKARPYFREKVGIFSKGINQSIKNNDPVKLMEYNINFQLIDFIIKHWDGKIPTRIQSSYDKVVKARQNLIENNLPLVINRAKIFYRKTPPFHLNLLDFIGICTIGLINGIDKYVGNYKEVWAGVCIGRMVGNMIEEYSKTFLRLYPTDKKILYRINSIRYKLKIKDIAELTAAVNKSFEIDKKEGRKVPSIKINEIYVQNLLNGTNYVSADSRSGGDNKEGVNIYDYTPQLTDNAEEQMIKNDLLKKAMIAAEDLLIIERKIIKLTGAKL